MFMHKLPVSFILFLIAARFSCLIAQKNFQPAQLARINGDTVAGWIDDQKWIISPKTIEFRQQADGPSQVITPLEVNAFFVGHEWYGGRKVLLDKSSKTLNEISDYAQPDLQSDTLFLQAIILGKANLWKGTDGHRGVHFFLEKKDLPIELLVFKTYYGKDASGMEGVKTNQKFRGQLSFYLGDCPKAVALSVDASYKEAVLKKIVKTYNYCFPEGIQFVKSKEKLRFETSASIGVSRLTLNMHDSYDEALQRAAFPAFTQMTGGLNLNIIFPRQLGRWAIYNSLMCESRKTAAQVRFRVLTISSYADRSLYFKDLRLRWYNLIRYQFRKRRLEPFVCAGFSHAVTLKSTHTDHIDTYFGGSFSTREGTFNTYWGQYERAFTMAVGIQYHRFQFEARAGFANDSFLTYAPDNINTSGLYLLGSYLF